MCFWFYHQIKWFRWSGKTVDLFTFTFMLVAAMLLCSQISAITSSSSQNYNNETQVVIRYKGNETCLILLKTTLDLQLIHATISFFIKVYMGPCCLTLCCLFLQWVWRGGGSKVPASCLSFISGLLLARASTLLLPNSLILSQCSPLLSRDKLA